MNAPKRFRRLHCTICDLNDFNNVFRELSKSRDLLDQFQRDLRSKDSEIDALNKRLESLESDDHMSQLTIPEGEMGRLLALRTELEQHRQKTANLTRELRELRLARQESKIIGLSIFV
jgi:chromosome segregation ATPase